MTAETKTPTLAAASETWSSYPLSLAQGERPLIFTHEQYRSVRAAGLTAQYDLLMRRPDDPDAEKPMSEDDRWTPVAAEKYLKHRASEWREAGDLSELPERWRDRAEALSVSVEAGESS